MKYKQHFWLIHLVLTIVLIALFLFAAKYWSVNDVFILPVSSILILFWAVCHLKIRKSKKKHSKLFKKVVVVSPTYETPLEAWEKDFPESKKLPIIIVTGHKQAGKSRLLSSIEPATATKIDGNNHWMLFKQFIAVEIPTEETFDHWSHLILSLGSQRHKITGIICCLSTENLNDDVEHYFEVYSQQLLACINRVKHKINIYFVLTHLDKLTGFSEFSSHLSHEKMKESFAFHSEYHDSTDWVNDICQKLDAQGEKFQNQRLHQLEKHTTLACRRNMHAFADEFIRITNILKQGLHFLGDKFKYTPDIKGIFFSAMPYQEKKSHYFSKTILTQIIQQSANPQKSRVRELMAFSLIVVFAIVMATWLKYFIIDMQLMHNIKQSIQYNNLNNISQLKQWKQDIENQNSVSALGIKMNTHLYQEISFLYKEKLTQYVNTRLDGWFNDNLLQSSNDELYNNLQIYLMLHHLECRNMNQLQLWREQHANLIEKDIFDAYLQNQLILPLNEILIQKAQERLSHLSENELNKIRYVNFENTTKEYTILFTQAQLDEINRVFITEPNQFLVPTIYTKNWFLENYSNIVQKMNIKTTCQLPMSLHQDQELKNMQSISSLYSISYINTWNKIDTLHLQTTKNLNEAYKMLSLLSQSNSPFDIVLTAFNNNTNYKHLSKKPFTNTSTTPQDIENMQVSLEEHFGTSTQFFDKNQASMIDYHYIQANLQILNEDVKKMLLLPDNAPAIFNFIKLHKNGTANDAFEKVKQALPYTPQPLRGWLEQLLNQIWSAVQKKADKELNGQWKNDVMTFYTQALQHRYPLDKNASEDAFVTDFNHFYSPDGVVDKFKKSHVWKNVGTESIGNVNSNKAIQQQLENADKIQQAFFSAGSKKVHVEFSLKPYSLSPNVAQVKLVISGKTLVYGHGPQLYQHFSWHGKEQKTALIWTDLNGKEYRNITQNAWGIFKLLQHATIKKIKEEHLITFHQHGFSASFILKANSVFNPFTMILEQQN